MKLNPKDLDSLYENDDDLEAAPVARKNAKPLDLGAKIQKFRTPEIEAQKAEASQHFGKKSRR